MRHAEAIGPLLRGVLGDAGVGPHRLDGVALGMGPGPFTGLRVGIAAGTAFAFGADLPVLAVVSPDAIAAARFAAHGPARIQVVTDARRREHYVTAYDGVDADGLPVRVDHPRIAVPDDVDRAGFARIDAAVVPVVELGRIAARRRALGRAPDLDVPLYLRSPDVTLQIARKRVSA